jgi:hypothetical protein
MRTRVRQAGKDLTSEVLNMYVSPPIAQALVALKRADSETEARSMLKSQFPSRTASSDISTDEFLRAVRSALMFKSRNDRLPCTVVILDEVQQYLGGSADRANAMTEVSEALSKDMNGAIILVCAGQSALSTQTLLQRMFDRFMIKIALSDTDVEKVTREVLLRKKPAAVEQVRELLKTHAGEISRQLQSTRIREISSDTDVIVEDYPLLPVRRRFWEHSFRKVDAGGMQSQLRSQLQIVYEAVRGIADKELGAIIPGDALFDALAPEMVNTGVLLKDINETILKLDDGTPQGKLARRICATIFLVSQLDHKGAQDLGVRATREHIADLLVCDLKADNAALRNQVDQVIKKLASDGVLVEIAGGEYRLQTKEGQEWDQDFRGRYNKIQGNVADLQLKTDQLISAQIQSALKLVKITQGKCRQKRDIVLSRDQSCPAQPSDAILLWVRDEWSTSRAEVLSSAQAAGSTSGILFAFVPKQHADDLKKAIIEVEAASQTVDARGTPQNEAGIQAQQGILTRIQLAERERNRLIEETVNGTEIYQGGGTRLFNLTLQERIFDAATQALARIYPRFHLADAPDANAWGKAKDRVRDGADEPFQPVGYVSAPIEQHPVCQEVLTTIAAGQTGSQVRKRLGETPFGWPQDAVDVALLALLRYQHVNATLNGSPVTAAQLDQTKIAKTEFRREVAAVPAQDRLKLRKLFADAGVKIKGDDVAAAGEFLEILRRLAISAGGDPPLPPRPNTVMIEDLTRQQGNQQLADIRARQADLEDKLQQWKQLANVIEQRLPEWRLAERLAYHGRGSPQAAEFAQQLQDIGTHRLLADSTNRISPARAGLAAALRAAIQTENQAHEIAYTSGMAQLNASSDWQRISDQDRTSILAEVGLIGPEVSDVSTDELLAQALDARSLQARRAEVDAVAGRVLRALEKAAKLVEPKAQVIQIESATLRNEDEVNNWVDRHHKKLAAAVKNGPVFIQ